MLRFIFVFLAAGPLHSGTTKLGVLLGLKLSASTIAYRPI